MSLKALRIFLKNELMSVVDCESWCEQKGLEGADLVHRVAEQYAHWHPFEFSSVNASAHCFSDQLRFCLDTWIYEVVEDGITDSSNTVCRTLSTRWRDRLEGRPSYEMFDLSDYADWYEEIHETQETLIAEPQLEVASA